MRKDKEFTLYWKTSDREVVQGKNAAEAMTLAGYGGGALRALDFYAEGNDHGYKWDEIKQKWVKVEGPKHERHTIIR